MDIKRIRFLRWSFQPFYGVERVPHSRAATGGKRAYSPTPRRARLSSQIGIPLSIASFA